MDRRTLLALSASGLAVVALGCEATSPTISATPTDTDVGTGSPPVPSSPPLLDEVAAGREADLQVINASVEQLTGPDRLWAFGLVGPDNQPVRDADVAVWVGDGPDANGPFPTTFRDIPNQPLGLYATRIDVATPGDTPVVAVLADGTAAGYTTLRAVDPADSVAPAPGDPAVRVQTPTDQERMGFASLCTEDPPCSMHEQSLATLLDDGLPIVLTVATPAFCETAICGPTIGIIEELRATEELPSEIAWVHLEVFVDDGITLADQVAAWGLPSEPWIFGIDPSGTVRARLDGPLTVLREEIIDLARSTVA